MPSPTRRQALAALGATAAGSVAGCLAGLTCRQNDVGAVEGSWPTAGHDARHSGYNRDADGPGDDPTPGWCFEPPVSGVNVSLGTPVVASGAASRLDDPTGAVYVPSRVRPTEAAHYNGYVHALDAATGEERHRFAHDCYVEEPPAVTDDAVVLVGEPWRGAKGGRVLAFGRTDARERWRYDLNAAVEGGPTVADGTVYVADRAGRVHALDAADGSRRWRIRIETDRDHALLVGSPAVVDGRAFLADHGRRALVALDAADGSVAWEVTDVRGAVEAGPVVAGDLVLLLTGETLVAVDAATGDHRWAAPAVTVGRGDRPAADGERAYVPGRTTLSAVRLDDGAETWSVERDGGFAGQPAVAGGTVAAPTYDGLVGVDAADGTERWHLDVDDRPAVADDVLFAADGDRLRSFVPCDRPVFC